MGQRKEAVMQPNLRGYPAFHVLTNRNKVIRMADDSDARRSSASIRNTPHAPTVYFDGAPLSGCANGVVSIALGVNCPEASNGEVRVEAVIAAYLKCSIPAALNLRAAIDNALLRASRAPPQVAAQDPKFRKN
jgi:hypothetical protein